MARPTNDPKTNIIRVRVNDELARELASYGDNLSGTIREMIYAGIKATSSVPLNSTPFDVPQDKKSFSDSVLHENSVSHDSSVLPSWWEESKDIISDIEQMVKLSGGSMADFLSMLDEKLMMGEVTVTGLCPFDYKGFMDACYEKGVDPQEAINRAAQMVWRS